MVHFNSNVLILLSFSTLADINVQTAVIRNRKTNDWNIPSCAESEWTSCLHICAISQSVCPAQSNHPVSVPLLCFWTTKVFSLNGRERVSFNTGGSVQSKANQSLKHWTEATGMNLSTMLRLWNLTILLFSVFTTIYGLTGISFHVYIHSLLEVTALFDFDKIQDSHPFSMTWLFMITAF